MEAPARTIATTAGLPKRFDAVRELGAGLSGRVWLAVDRASGARVVVKRFHTGGPNDAPIAELEPHYAALARASEHAALCRVHAFEVDDDGAFAVLAHVRGRALGPVRARVERHARRSRTGAPSQRRDERRLRVVLGAIEGVLSGLAQLHAAGIAHGDCHANNVFWSHGRLVLLDYDRLLGRDALGEEEFALATRDDLRVLADTLGALARSLAPVATLDATPKGIALAHGRGGRAEFGIAELAWILHGLSRAGRAGGFADARAAADAARQALEALAASGDERVSRRRALRRRMHADIAQALRADLPPRPRWSHPLPLVAACCVLFACVAAWRGGPSQLRVLGAFVALTATLVCLLRARRTRAERGARMLEAARRTRALRAQLRR